VLDLPAGELCGCSSLRHSITILFPALNLSKLVGRPGFSLRALALVVSASQAVSYAAMTCGATVALYGSQRWT